MEGKTKPLNPQLDPLDIRFHRGDPWELAPSNEIFKEIIDAAIVIWKTFDDTYGYASEKIARVKRLVNDESEVMVALRMFHPNLRKLLISKLSPEAQEYIKYQGE